MVSVSVSFSFRSLLTVASVSISFSFRSLLTVASVSVSFSSRSLLAVASVSVREGHGQFPRYYNSNGKKGKSSSFQFIAL